MSRRTLQKWYAKYNRDYFGGKLPKVSLGFALMPRTKFGHTTKVGDRFEVDISGAIFDMDKTILFTLLHEMAHIKLWQRYPRHQHGEVFCREMRRLAREGAFDQLW